ncbi:MAG: MoxR family ATPase [Cyclobacteriaceae bacterium]|nr:MoxR family ATPase [Cyclobacteriaceae bacterium]MCK5705990.1 MoxR family ATPase [Cyclobacteriaceae bacterium]
MELSSSFESRIELTKLKEKTDTLRRISNSILVGQQKMFDLILTALLADGHVLIEGVPGIAKTLTAKVIAKLIDADFSRIQFTPDLMPSDVLGTSVYNMKKSEFEFKKGPLFSNVILIDEINRSPAKTQAALIEVMEERQISIDGNTYVMDPLYLVLATQNPIEHEGTYKLPEAQLDRFLFKINIDYLNKTDEIEILNRHHHNIKLADVSSLKPEINTKDILDFRSKIKDVHIEKNLIEYIAAIVEETRRDKSIYLGASPRAGIAMLNGSKAFAALKGRDFVTPEDIKFIAEPVLNHRLILTPESEMEGRSVMDVCKKIIEKIEVPR